MAEFLRGAFSQANVVTDGNDLVLRYASTSIALWCIVPLLAAIWGAGGWFFVRWHQRKAPIPHPSATPVKVFSTCMLLFAAMVSVVLIPALFLTEIRVTPTEATQTVGFWWEPRRNVFSYDRIVAIVVTLEEDDVGPEPVWRITWKDTDSIEIFNPGDLWSANQQVIRQRMQQHGVVFAELD